MVKKYFLFSIAMMIIVLSSAQKIYNVKNFGAVGDGKTDDAVAIQKAIDACTEAGGGLVLFPGSHTFLASPFNLKSNIDFHIEAGAKVLANPDVKVYTKSAFRQNPGEGTIWIGGENIENLTISGTGEIDGNGISFMGAELEDSYVLKPFNTLDPRPHVLTIIGGKNIRISRNIGVQARRVVQLVAVEADRRATADVHVVGVLGIGIADAARQAQPGHRPDGRLKLDALGAGLAAVGDDTDDRAAPAQHLHLLRDLDVVVVHAEHGGTEVEHAAHQRALGAHFVVGHALVGEAGLLEVRRPASGHVVDVPAAAAKALAVGGVHDGVAVQAPARADQRRHVAGAQAVVFERERRRQEGWKGDDLLVGQVLLLPRVAQATGQRQAIAQVPVHVAEHGSGF